MKFQIITLQKAYRLPDPVRSSNGRYDVIVWELQCRFNKKRHQRLYYIEFCKSRVVTMLLFETEAGTGYKTLSVSSRQEARLYT
jgi:hypothetical protein